MLKNYIMPVLGKVPLSAIDIAHWYQVESIMRERGLQQFTIDVNYARASRILSYAVERKLGINHHPWHGQRKKKPNRRRKIQLPTTEEIAAIIATAHGTRFAYLGWIVETIYFTGVRPGRETLGLRWENLDWNRAQLRVFAPKTQTWRTLDLDPPFMERLTEQQRAFKTAWGRCPEVICPGNHGQPLRRTDGNAWHQLLARAGVRDNIRPYDLRHFFISWCLASGKDIMQVAEMVGHETPRMIVQVYAHLVKELRGNRLPNMPNLHDGRQTVDKIPPDPPFSTV